jgi:hypothetical protein
MATAPACQLNGQGTSYTNASVTPGCIITGGLNLKGVTFDLLPGTYWITDGDLQLGPGGGTLQCTTCTAGGAGVTIILTTQKANGGTVGTVLLQSLANLNLIAPSTGPFAGMVLIQDGNGVPAGDTIKSDTGTPANGNAQESLSGLVYFPASTLSFRGTPTGNVGAANCMVVVANHIQLQGNPTMAVGGCGSLGLTTLPFPKTVTLIQ